MSIVGQYPQTGNQRNVNLLIPIVFFICDIPEVLANSSSRDHGNSQSYPRNCANLGGKLSIVIQASQTARYNSLQLV